jgi:hypothetical protein
LAHSKRRVHLKDPAIDGNGGVDVKEIGSEGANWTQLAQVRDD